MLDSHHSKDIEEGGSLMANVKVIEANKSSRRQRNLFMENQLRVAA